MKLYFKDKQPVNASGETPWEVITNLPSYPRFNPMVGPSWRRDRLLERALTVW